MQGKGAGPKTVAALLHLSEASASLTPPPPKVVTPKPKPILSSSIGCKEQQQALDAAREYALNLRQNPAGFHLPRGGWRYIDRRYKPGTEGSWAIGDRLAEKLTYYDQWKWKNTKLISRNDDSLFGKTAESVGGALNHAVTSGTLITRDLSSPNRGPSFIGSAGGTWTGICSMSTPLCHRPAAFKRNHRRQPFSTGDLALHGEVFVEKGPNTIWRITVVPEPPASFPIQNILERLDYRYTDISGQKFLLPVTGQIIMKADGTGTKNEIEFPVEVGNTPG